MRGKVFSFLKSKKEAALLTVLDFGNDGRSKCHGTYGAMLGRNAKSPPLQIDAYHMFIVENVK